MSEKKTAVITGATSGLGEAAALAFAAAGWRVLVLGRDAARGEDVVARARAGGGDAAFIAADLFTVAGVRAAAERVRSRSRSIDLLVNNAGGTFRELVRTPDGLERTAALNVMAPWLLTESLLDPLTAARGRVVNVVTGLQRFARATAEEVLGARASAGMGAYVRAKLALLALTRAQQSRYGARGLTVVALHPGVILETRFGQEMPRLLSALGPLVTRIFGMRSTLAQASARYLRVGAGEVTPGAYYYEDAPRDPPPCALDEAFADDLWARLAALVGAEVRSAA